MSQFDHEPIKGTDGDEEDIVEDIEAAGEQPARVAETAEEISSSDEE